MRWQLPLNARETARLYWELSRRGAYLTGERFSWKYENLSEEELTTLAILQTRYDPRLMAVMIDYLSVPHPGWNPVLFKETLRQREGLPLAAVIGEFVLESAPLEEVKDLFWFLQAGVSPVPNQLFYRGLYPVGARKMEEAISRPIWAFKKWGFLAADPPFLKDRVVRRRCYLFDQDSRRNLLFEMAKKKKRFRLRDYLQEIHFSISRQQALRDLSWLRRRGKGKGTLYEFPKMVLHSNASGH